MNTNMTVKYKEYKEKKAISPLNVFADGFAGFISAMIYGAEFTAYVLGYLFSSVYLTSRAFAKTKLCRMIVGALQSLGVALVCVAFFGVVGGMEAGTISLPVGLIVCAVMCLCGALTSAIRK